MCFYLFITLIFALFVSGVFYDTLHVSGLEVITSVSELLVRLLTYYRVNSFRE